VGASRPFVCQQPHDVYKRVDDSALVVAVQGGDVAAYAELFRRHHRNVKRVCARRLGELEADEVAQATFVRAFERIQQCEGDRRFGAWVQVIAQRLCLDLVRARSRTVPDDDPLRGDRPALNVVIDLDAGTVTEEALVRRERTERVQEALALLPDRQREVVVARHFEGRRPPEIAASLGLSVGAVDSLLLRGRRRLALNYEHAMADSLAAAPSVTSAGAGVAGAVPVHLPALPDAVVHAAQQAVAALPAVHGDGHAPLRRLAGMLAAAAVPILVSAPPQPAAPTHPAPALVAPVAPVPVAAAAATAAPSLTGAASLGGQGGPPAGAEAVSATVPPAAAIATAAANAAVIRPTTAAVAPPGPARPPDHPAGGGGMPVLPLPPRGIDPPGRPTAPDTAPLPAPPPVPAVPAVPAAPVVATVVAAPATPAGPPLAPDGRPGRWVTPAAAAAAAHGPPTSAG
jgi:RNA polymerase sigma-70 factor (ECF subfamily)